MNTKNSLFLFLFLIAAWAGTCSAQTAQKSYRWVSGLFFNGTPPCMTMSDVVAIILHKDEVGNQVTELRLRRGFELPEVARKYAVPDEEVPGAEALLMSIRGELGKKLMNVAAVRTLQASKWIGQPFPDFKVTDTTGREWSNADIAGRPMILNFWYTGCGPCIKEMPTLSRWMEICPEAVYLATTFDSAEQIRKIVETRPFRFTQIADDLFFFKTFNVSGMPVTILVDRKGIIRCIEEGGGEPKLRYLEDQWRMLTAE